MRKSSKASTWMPEGKGYQVFETAPVGMPPIAKAKADTAWGKQAVQATIRAWYNMMLVDQPELQSIKREWEDRFDKLPIDVELTDIDPALRLKWEYLPVRTWQRRAAGRQCFAADARAAARGERGISDSLENPPINPITGHGRTAAEVAQDARSYQAYVRAQPGGELAVFQADYLFVQPPGQSLQLHRICSELFMEDALDPKVRSLNTTLLHPHHQPSPPPPPPHY